MKSIFPALILSLALYQKNFFCYFCVKICVRAHVKWKEVLINHNLSSFSNLNLFLCFCPLCQLKSVQIIDADLMWTNVESKAESTISFIKGEKKRVDNIFLSGP